MIREEKIKRLKALKARCERLIVSSDRGPEEWRKDAEALDLALTALRPVSREQVEKVWRGEWRLFDDCANEGLYCSQCGKKVYRVEYANVKMATRFCPNCMSAMTDEAVEMVMERINKMEETGNGLG